jgi:hypothetical protein
MYSMRDSLVPIDLASQRGEVAQATSETALVVQDIVLR